MLPTKVVWSQSGLSTSILLPSAILTTHSSVCNKPLSLTDVGTCPPTSPLPSPTLQLAVRLLTAKPGERVILRYTSHHRSQGWLATTWPGPGKDCHALSLGMVGAGTVWWVG